MESPENTKQRAITRTERVLRIFQGSTGEINRTQGGIPTLTKILQISNRRRG